MIDEAENGAHYIDANAGTFVGQKAQYLTWLVKAVQEVVDIPCCIDGPDPGAIQAARAVGFKDMCPMRQATPTSDETRSTISLQSTIRQTD